MSRVVRDTVCVLCTDSKGLSRDNIGVTLRKRSKITMARETVCERFLVLPSVIFTS
jgi:hypothetical protein